MSSCKPFFTLLALGLFCPALSASAQTITAHETIFAPINGINTEIGVLEAKQHPFSGGAEMDAIFKENDIGRMYDNNMCTFDWFQVVESDTLPAPVAFDGSIPQLQYADPVINGYADDVTAAKTPGHDQAPYYLDGPGFPGSVIQYADHYEQGDSVNTFDVADNIKNSKPVVESIQFTTYLIARCPNYAPQQFDLLGAFTWGYTNDLSGNTNSNGPIFLNLTDADVKVADMAIQNGGFPKTWSATRNADLTTICPEPSSVADCGVVALVAAGLMLKARKRRVA